MILTPIYHSGVLVETAECYYLFDYYKGALPDLDPAKPIIVFVSHSHTDHYNPEIFSLLREIGFSEILAVLPNDIKKHKYPTGYPLCNEAPAWNHIFKVYHSTTYELPCETVVTTLLSTDSGVAYLVSCPSGVVYHAGDLNEWILPDMPIAAQKQMTGNYRAAIKRIEGRTIDYACLPLDPHMEDNYAGGLLYFLDHTDTKKVCPIHYWDRPEIVDRFKKEYPQYADCIL